MFLPVHTNVDLPLIPAMGKDTIPVLAAIIGCWLIKNKKIKFFSNKGLLQLLVLSIFFGPFITTLLNNDRIFLANRFLPELTLHDAISILISQFLQISAFFLGKQFFRTYPDQLYMFRFLVMVGLIYSILMLLEIRMSPQLHNWVYGFFPHSFGQQIRGSGFRPVVFMGHGLWVAFFTVCVVVAASVLTRINEKIRNFPPSMVNYYLVVVLVLCKSKASLAYGLFAFLMIKTITLKNQMNAAVLLALLALSYPTLSIMNIFPHQQVIEVAETLMGPVRAESLVFRFDNEKVLLNHAKEKFFFGWGGWGRNRVYNEKTGENITVTDGRWVITFGVYGMVGFIAEFGLLAISVVRARQAAKWLKNKKEYTLLSAHALLISLVMVDQLPNATLDPWLWLLSGVLLGRSEEIIAVSKKGIANKSRTLINHIN